MNQIPFKLARPSRHTCYEIFYLTIYIEEDVTLNLDTGVFKPFIKPGDKPLYVNSDSNHPPCVIKNIPKGINQRLSSISSSKEVFDQAAPLYQSELDRNGYTHQLQYEPPREKSGKRNRRKRVLYFNPPYSMDVSTKVGKLFLQLLDESFPPGHPLHPLLNRNTVKLSYSCLPNMGSQIAKHNAKILKTIETTVETVPPKKCNCNKKTDCPLENNCAQAINVIYHATVKTENSSETYVGSTTNFKKRFYNYNSDFSKPSRRFNTTLSAHCWSLKDTNQKSDITWKIIGKAPSFSPVTGTCQLCTTEKFKILFNPEICSLNTRNEIFGHCRHKEKVLLVKPVRKKRRNGS